jgi:hypothetical protein
MDAVRTASAFERVRPPSRTSDAEKTRADRPAFLRSDPEKSATH